MHIAAPPSQPKSPVEYVKQFFERFGHMMSRIILSGLYLILIAPPGLVYLLLLDPLRMKKRPATNWVPFKTSNTTVEAARRQA